MFKPANNPKPCRAIVRPLLSGAAALFATISVSAVAGPDANLYWDIETDRNSFTLTLRQRQERAALPFNAACKENGDLKLTLGAPLDKVAKAGERVTVTLEAGGVKASVTGKAHFNAFTKVHELSVGTDVKNPVFAVLAANAPIKVGGSAKTPVTWPAPNAEAVKLWATDCQFRSEH